MYEHDLVLVSSAGPSCTDLCWKIFWWTNGT